MTSYGKEILGRRVLIEFIIDDLEIRAFFKGFVSEYKVQFNNNTVTEEHLVVFDDDDRRWFNLNQEEQMGRLKWFNEVQLPAPANQTHVQERNTK